MAVVRNVARLPARQLSAGWLHLARRPFSDFISSEPCSGRFHLAFAAACLPHPSKVERGGEDSYFACPASSSFGVADGVGGWAESGVDPGLFARRLLHLCLEGINSQEEETDLDKALMSATSQILAERLQGGSTALLGRLTGSTMAILNMGDSGAMLLRPALRTRPGSEQPLLYPRVVFRSSDQTHYFNCPYQLSSGGHQIEIPDLIRIRVRSGDVVVAATDGVFDNLFDHQVQAIVARHLGKAWTLGAPVMPHLQGLAAAIVRQAQRVGQLEHDRDVITPFAISAHSEGLSFRGGKLDDTTVVVGLVCNDSASSSDRQELLQNF
eukprot:TRINITY_DN69182_c0_g1_i1.p1 TRINITY_DN69182_c0_g1~~TRINITY_DN69182_c0_g1_i1.p1  ORF type:complete len:337 (+),score=53.06 TRINITY_DN69182_c0_g1_i1:39-1013(+)